MNVISSHHSTQRIREDLTPHHTHTASAWPVWRRLQSSSSPTTDVTLLKLIKLFLITSASHFLSFQLLIHSITCQSPSCSHNYSKHCYPISILVGRLVSLLSWLFVYFLAFRTEPLVAHLPACFIVWLLCHQLQRTITTSSGNKLSIAPRPLPFLLQCILTGGNLGLNSHIACIPSRHWSQTKGDIAATPITSTPLL